MKKVFFRFHACALFFLLFPLAGCSSLNVSVSPEDRSIAGDAPEEAAVSAGKKEAQKTEPARISDPRAYYHYLAGSLLEMDNNIPGAYQEYKQALSIDSKSQFLLFELANISLRLGDFESAKSYVKTLLEEDPEHVEALMLSGEIHVSQNELNEAVAAYQKA